MRLNKFLVNAKINTYASNGEVNETLLEDGFKELVYKEGNFSYRDRYFGFNPFCGEEVVFEEGKAIWMMNYYGEVFEGEMSAKKIYEFLKKAMKKVGEERPFRGPNNFKEGYFEYIDMNNGSINKFNGVETILYKGKEVYRLTYHGGNVKK